MLTVVQLEPAETHPIRRAVLRNDTPDDRVEFDGDELADTLHLGVDDDGELVAISTWLVRRYPDLPEHPGHQLRGMATLPARRGSGVGAMLLEAGLDRCRSAGSELVWARARETALGFYLAHGFETVGVGYVDLTTALPHRDIVRRLGVSIRRD